MTISERPHHIYYHYDESGSVVYIGVASSPDRPMTLRGRSKEHKELMTRLFNDYGPSFIEVPHEMRNLTREEAFEKERLEIDRLRPKFNRYKNGNYKRRRRTDS